MTNRPKPDHYRPIQIVLHWIVVLGVISQIAVHDQIVAVVEALRLGETPNSADLPWAWMHVGVGSTILLAVLARLYLRYRYGAPGHAPGTSPAQAKMASIMHWGLYGLLLGMVVTGMLTWNGIAPLGGVHFVINVVLFFAVLAHAAAAVFNHFVRKDGTLSRMSLSRRT